MLMKTAKGVTLNVKDPEARRLARAIVRVTGETLTRAVTQALRERYERLQARSGIASFEELLAIARRATARVKQPDLNPATLLHNQRGLSK